MPPSSPRRQSRSRPRSRRRTAPPRSSVSPSRCRSEQTQKPMFPPERIVCLTEETVETLYLLGEERRIVGVSGYAVRPARVRREKPRISAFISADFEKILALEPDLVLAFSDLQADIAAELIRRNVAVHAFNQRDIAGILDRKSTRLNSSHVRISYAVFCLKKKKKTNKRKRSKKKKKKNKIEN